MRILEKGPGWSVECVCTGKGNGGAGCGSKLLVEKGDLYQTSHSDYGGGTDYFVTFCCPVCGVETDAEGTPFHGYDLQRRSRNQD
ncbi:hypothetical protein HZC53_00680 [Candidatus Uhrbacteria bacterium]|nr:hypothetical protein [Candidatus Uhrbacteria bacterium]